MIMIGCSRNSNMSRFAPPWPARLERANMRSQCIRILAAPGLLLSLLTRAGIAPIQPRISLGQGFDLVPAHNHSIKATRTLILQNPVKEITANLLDFLDAERSYRATELAYRQAAASYVTAIEQLKYAMGRRNLP